VARWRLRESLRRTLERRPDLVDETSLTPDARSILEELRLERRD
jgi:tRNA (guanine37-N1)-methyltransferase